MSSRNRDLIAGFTGSWKSDVTRARLAALVASSADAIIGQSLDGIVTDWNPAAERLYGYRADEVIGKSPAMLIPPERLSEAAKILARVRGGESIVEFESVRYARNGRQFDISLTVSPVRNDDGEIIATSTIVRDISQRKASERALAESEALFRVAFENAPIGMALVAPDERLLRVNHAICHILGYTEAELLTRTLRGLTHPDDVATNRDLVERALAGELDSYQLEKRYIRQDGGIVWALLRVSLVRDETGVPIYFISQIQDITARKAAAEELAAAHQQTRDVLERITDGFCAFDREWRFTYLNEAAERIMNRSRTEILGQNLWQTFPPTVNTPLYETYHQAMADGVTASIEFFFPPQGTWFDVRAYPSPDGLSVFFRDVTESHRLAQQARASEVKYQTLVEQLPVVVYLLSASDTEGALYFSPHIKALLGSRAEQEMAHSGQWLARVHLDDRERVAAQDARSNASGELFRLEYRLLRDDGSYIWVRDECSPLYDDTGAIVAWQGVLVDMSDRIKAEEIQSRLAAIVAGAQDAITSRTLDGTITSWNHGAEQLYGYREEEMIGQSLSVLLPEGKLPDSIANTEDYGGRPRQAEAIRRHKDGSLIDVAISISPIRDRNGAITGIAAITRDITARKRAEEQLRSALEEAKAGIRAKDLFLAMMSHELRTPLQAVLGYADFLLHREPDSLTAEQREDIGYIHQGAGRMVALIEQMLDLSRMEAGRLTITSKPVNLAEIMEQVRQDVAPQAAAKALAFDIILPPHLPLVLGDPVRLRQILLNLIDNAVKFTDRGSVQMAATVTATGVDVSISDTGIGIAADALPHIFEEFRQVDNNLSRRYGGAGLGLAISQRLAEQMGGSITVASQPGTGSTFLLHLLAATRHWTNARTDPT